MTKREMLDLTIELKEEYKKCNLNKWKFMREVENLKDGEVITEEFKNCLVDIALNSFAPIERSWGKIRKIEAALENENE